MSQPSASAHAWAEAAVTTASAPPVGAAELASTLAAKMCHDFISPASAIVSGLDLLEDPTAADMREDAMKLIEGSARKLTAMLAFARIAYGASASAETFGAAELETLTRGVFASMRAELDWAVGVQSLNKPAAKALLNLAAIGGGALPTGGKAKVVAQERPGEVVVGVEATGPRARLRPEVAAGLKGEPLGEGLGGHWVQAYYLSTLLKAAGGQVEFAADEQRVVFRARIPGF